MVKEAIGPRVAAIIERETKPIRHIDPNHQVLTAVSRAGHMAAREAEVVVSEDHTLRGIADMLGVEPKTAFSDAPWRSGYMHQRVSPEVRELYGLGDLPDGLIIDVNQAVLQGLPEYEPPESAKLLASRTMLVVRDKPHILAHELRLRLAEMNEDGAFNTHNGGMSMHTLVAMDGVVIIAHEMAAQYFTAHAQMTQELAEITNGAEALNG